MKMIPEYFTDGNGFRHHLIACQIQYSSIQVRCCEFRTRDENLSGAWKFLVEELKFREWAIPHSRKEFELFGGKVNWYTSY